MSKRKARPHRKSVRKPRRRKRPEAAIGLVLCLVIGAGILAGWKSLKAKPQLALKAAMSQPLAEPAAAPAPSISPTPAFIAKDYIYAGGRLVATETKATNNSQGQGIAPGEDDEGSETPPPPIIYTDIAVFRPSNGTWYVLNTVDGSLTAQMWGMNGDKPVPGDYDGDGKLDFAVFRPSDSHWYILRSLNGAMDAPVWGLSTDEPVPGDYDGDGKTDVAVRRGSMWYIVKSTDPSNYVAQAWGADTDLAVPGDYDGDGKTDIATFRPSDATWTILKSSSPPEAQETIEQQWGASADVPQVGDFDGDNITDFATFRLSDNIWRIFSTFDSSSIEQQWGASTDKPVPGDYDGDGKTDIAVVRPRVSETDDHSTWYILKSSDGSWMVQQWGQDGDIAVPGKYNRAQAPVCTSSTPCS